MEPVCCSEQLDLARLLGKLGPLQGQCRLAGEGLHESLSVDIEPLGLGGGAQGKDPPGSPRRYQGQATHGGGRGLDHEGDAGVRRAMPGAQATPGQRRNWRRQ